MARDERHPETVPTDRSMLVHRALADPTRATLYQLLRASGQTKDVSALADGLGVHPNTVRSHLQILEEAGLVTSVFEKRVRPGRPRRLFDAMRDPSEEEHRLLAAALAGVLEPLADGSTLAEKAGRQAGRQLVVAGAVTGATPVARVVALLDERGFAASEEDDTIAMHRCPFGDVAEDHPDIVCGFHAGLVAGALEEAGSAVELRSLDPWEREGACVAHLAQADDGRL
ncbi:MAG: helix-turn-helix domain-containing protein [Actinobacteria bacterium]|nr:helix-turn-helix domain-containing protein [Actinomycetota bacterium]